MTQPFAGVLVSVSVALLLPPRFSVRLCVCCRCTCGADHGQKVLNTPTYVAQYRVVMGKSCASCIVEARFKRLASAAFITARPREVEASQWEGDRTFYKIHLAGTEVAHGITRADQR